MKQMKQWVSRLAVLAAILSVPALALAQGDGRFTGAVLGAVVLEGWADSIERATQLGLGAGRLLVVVRGHEVEQALQQMRDVLEFRVGVGPHPLGIRPRAIGIE